MDSCTLGTPSSLGGRTDEGRANIYAAQENSPTHLRDDRGLTWEIKKPGNLPKLEIKLKEAWIWGPTQAATEAIKERRHVEGHRRFKRWRRFRNQAEIDSPLIQELTEESDLSNDDSSGDRSGIDTTSVENHVDRVQKPGPASDERHQDSDESTLGAGIPGEMLGSDKHGNLGTADLGENRSTLKRIHRVDQESDPHTREVNQSDSGNQRTGIRSITRKVGDAEKESGIDSNSFLNVTLGETSGRNSKGEDIHAEMPSTFAEDESRLEGSQRPREADDGDAECSQTALGILEVNLSDSKSKSEGQLLEDAKAAEPMLTSVLNSFRGNTDLFEGCRSTQTQEVVLERLWCFSFGSGQGDIGVN
jgi:hypothetical protein